MPSQSRVPRGSGGLAPPSWPLLPSPLSRVRAQLRSARLAPRRLPPKRSPLARETKTRCPRDPDNPRNQPRVRRPLSPPPLPLGRERARLARVPLPPEPRMRTSPPPWLRAHQSTNQLNGSGSLNIAPPNPPEAHHSKRALYFPSQLCPALLISFVSAARSPPL